MLLGGYVINEKLRAGVESLKRAFAPKRNESEEQTDRIATPTFHRVADFVKSARRCNFLARRRQAKVEALVEPELDYKNPGIQAAVAQAIFDHATAELIPTHNLHRVTISSRLLSKIWFPDFQEIVFYADKLQGSGLIGDVAKNALIHLHSCYAIRCARIDRVVAAYPSGTYKDTPEIKREVDEFLELARVWQRLAGNLAKEIRRE